MVGEVVMLERVGWGSSGAPPLDRLSRKRPAKGERCKNFASVSPFLPKIIEICEKARETKRSGVSKNKVGKC